MIDIIKHHHKYVPRMETTSIFQDITEDNVTIPVTKIDFHQIIFRGDQLTTARARGSQLDRVKSDNGIDQLQGVVPVFEDWHVKVLLLQVNFSILK